MTTAIMTSASPPDVLIVGAGITGMATALSLSIQGLSVAIVERYEPAAMASGWTLAGVRQSGRHAAEMPLARRAVNRWQSLDQQLGASTGYRQTGNLRLARTPAEVEVIEQLVSSQHAAGLDIELLQASALRKQFPALSHDVLCASLCSSDGQADPQATAAAYRRALERRGVQIHSRTAVNKLVIQSGRFHSLETDAGILQADTCLLATGVQTNDLLNPLERALPLRWAVVTVLQSEVLAPLLAPVIGVANADLALRQQSNGRLRMTGGAEFDNARLSEKQGQPHVDTHPQLASAIQQRIAAVLPAAADATITRQWGGLLDMTPDGLPVIDRVPGIDALVVAGGFCGHGFGIGPATGETVAELINHNTTSLDIRAFAFDRFNAEQASTAELHG